MPSPADGWMMFEFLQWLGDSMLVLGAVAWLLLVVFLVRAWRK